MQGRWLLSAMALFSLGLFVKGQDIVPASGKNFPSIGRLSAGYLIIPQGPNSPGQCVPYLPQPGDIVLYDNRNKFHHFVYKIAHTKAPIHASIVINREDGTPALLELTGPLCITAKVVIMEVQPRLASYPGPIMVRRLREPLTPEQSHEMTSFAQAQVGKRFALGRILLQATPFNAHAGVLRSLCGHTYLNRNRWFFSEMVVAAGTKANVFDPKVHFANATYPRDLAFDETMDISSHYHPPLEWVADRPATFASAALP